MTSASAAARRFVEGGGPAAGAPRVALGGDGAVWVATPPGARPRLRCTSRRASPRKPEPPLDLHQRSGRSVEKRASAPRRAFRFNRETSPRRDRDSAACRDPTAPVESSACSTNWMASTLRWPRCRPGKTLGAIFSQHSCRGASHAFEFVACNRYGILRTERALTYSQSISCRYFYQTAGLRSVACRRVSSRPAGRAFRPSALRRVIARLDSRFEERLRERTRLSSGELHDPLVDQGCSQRVHAAFHLASDSIPDRLSEKKAGSEESDLPSWIA
jgi:hypothetical protein